MESNQSPNRNKIKLWKWCENYTSFVYDKPYVPIVLVCFLTIGLFCWLFFGYGIKADANTNYYRWEGDQIANRWDSYVGASKETYPNILGLFGNTIPMPRQFQLTQMGAIIYERKGKNVLELECIRDIWKMETEMHATPGWSNYCFKVPYDGLPSFVQKIIRNLIDKMKNTLSALEEDTKCIAFKSLGTEISNWMKNELNYTGYVGYENLTKELLDEFWHHDNSSQLNRIAKTFLGNDFDPVKISTSRMRSMIPFALPIPGYRNKNDRQKEQTAKLGKWQLEFLKPMKKMQKEAPNNVVPYSGFSFALSYDISDLILHQVWWLVGSFLFLFIFAIISMKNFFTSLLGVLGVFLPIPSALAVFRIVFQIDHNDVINVIALFLICGIGADCIFILFYLFKQSKNIYGLDNKKRLAYAAQRSLIALGTSVSTSGVSFLALLTSGVRIMKFFGIFSFLLLLFTFLYTFTFYLGILSIWAAKLEFKKKKNDEFESYEEVKTNQFVSQPSILSTVTEDEPIKNVVPDYPYHGVFDFLHKKPVFKVNAAGIDVSNCNFYEKLFYNYITPIIYMYRLPIVFIFTVWAAIFGYFAFHMKTKSELQFLPDSHPLQRALTLVSNGFATTLNDFSFVYVWGLEEKPNVKFSDYLTVDQYGTPTYKKFDITNKYIQRHINWTWTELLKQPFIDYYTTVVTGFGVNPWLMWEPIVNFDEKIIEKNELIGPFIKIAFNYLNLTDPPRNLSWIEPDEYHLYAFAWQAALSKLSYEEPDSYIPGTLKANTVGFSLDDYSLKYIGMKANMKIPSEITVESLRNLHKQAMQLEQYIETHAKHFITDDGKEIDLNFQGFMTGQIWLTMITEEKLPQQIIKDVGVALAFVAIVILISTFNILYTIYVLYSMLSTIFLILGILYFTGWKIGTNEAIMISIASGFCADFIIQPMLALALDKSNRSLFGKIQDSLVTFCTPVSCAMITTLVAASFLYPCDILLFPPFASFLLGSGLFGTIQGFFTLPALISLLTPRKHAHNAENPIIYTDNNENIEANKE